MKAQNYFIMALVFAVIIAVFAVINVNLVEVNYLFGSGEAPLVLVILISALFGGLITGAFGAVRLFRLQRELKALKSQHKKNDEKPILHDDSKDELIENKETDPDINK